MQSSQCVVSGLSALLLYRDAGTHKGGDNLVVDGVDHLVEEFDGLNLINHQRVFLFVAYVAYGVLQFVKESEVFLPSVVNVALAASFKAKFML